MGMNDGVEIPVRIVPSGEQELNALANATRNLTEADKARSAQVDKGRAEVVRALQEEIMAHKNLGSAAAQAAMATLQAISPVIAEQTKLALATDKTTASTQRQGDAATAAAAKEEAAWRRSMGIWDAAIKENERRAAAAIKAAEQEAAARKKAEQEAQAGLQNLASNVRNAIQNPLAAMGQGAESLILTLGKVGVAVMGVGLVAGIAAKYSLEAAAATGKLAHEQLNLAERTGLTVHEVGTFTAAAKVLGVDTYAIQMSMRMLSQVMSENTEEGKKGKQMLADIGVQAWDTNGKLKPTGQMYLEIADALSRIEDPYKRADAAQKIFGRAGIELLPLLRGNLRDVVAEMEKIGVSFTKEGAEKAEEYEKALEKLGIGWAALKRQFGEGIIGIIKVIVPDLFKPGAAAENQLRARAQKSLREQKGWFYGSADRFSPEEEQQEMDRLRGEDDVAAYKGPKSEDRLQHRATQQAIAQNDAAVKAFTSSLETPEDKLKKLKKEITDLQASLKTGVLPSVNAPIYDQIHQKEREAEGIKAQVEATKDLKKIQAEADNALKHANEAEMTGLAKLRLERDVAIQQLAKFGAAGKKAAQEFRDAFDARGRVEAGKELDSFRRTVEAEAKKDKNGAPADLVNDRAQLLTDVGAFELKVKGGKMTLDQIDAQLDELKGRFQDVFLRERYFENLDRDSKAFSAEIKKRIEEDKAAIAELKKKWDEGTAVERADLTKDIQSIKDRTARQARIIEAGAAPGDEIAAYNKVAALKRDAAYQEAADAIKLADLHFEGSKRQEEEAKAYADLKRNLDDLEYDRTLKLMELRKRELSQFRETAGHVFDSLSQNGMTGLMDWIGGVAKTVERTIFQNLAEEVFRSAKDKLKTGDMIGGQVGKDGQLTMLGRLLKGTPFGVDQSTLLKQQDALATKDNTQATRDNTQALRELKAVGAGGAGPDGSGSWDNSDDPGAPGADASAAPGAKSKKSWMGTLGKVGAVAGGAAGVYAGIKQGGASGALTAIGSATATAAMLDPEPVSKALLMGVSMFTGLFGGLFGGGPKKFQKDQDNAIASNTETTDEMGNVYQGRGFYDGSYHTGTKIRSAPQFTNRTLDINGGDMDYSYMGKLRSMTQGATQINLTVHALDAQSIVDRSADIATAVHKELRLGNPLSQQIQQVILQS